MVIITICNEELEVTTRIIISKLIPNTSVFVSCQTLNEIDQREMIMVAHCTVCTGVKCSFSRPLIVLMFWVDQNKGSSAGTDIAGPWLPEDICKVI